MCELMDQIAERRAAEAAEEADIRARIDMAKGLIAIGKMTLEEIAGVSKLSLEKVKELADKRTA